MVKFTQRLSLLYTLLNKINKDNSDESSFVEAIRFIILDRIIDEYNANNINEARALFQELVIRIPANLYPLSPETAEFINNIKARLQ